MKEAVGGANDHIFDAPKKRNTFRPENIGKQLNGQFFHWSR